MAAQDPLFPNEQPHPEEEHNYSAKQKEALNFNFETVVKDLSDFDAKSKTIQSLATELALMRNKYHALEVKSKNLAGLVNTLIEPAVQSVTQQQLDSILVEFNCEGKF